MGPCWNLCWCVTPSEPNSLLATTAVRGRKGGLLQKTVVCWVERQKIGKKGGGREPLHPSTLTQKEEKEHRKGLVKQGNYCYQFAWTGGGFTEISGDITRREKVSSTKSGHREERKGVSRWACVQAFGDFTKNGFGSAWTDGNWKN